MCDKDLPSWSLIWISTIQKKTRMWIFLIGIILLAGSSSLIHHISLLLIFKLHRPEFFFCFCIVWCFFSFCLFLFYCFLILYGYVKYGNVVFLLLIKRCLINWFHYIWNKKLVLHTIPYYKLFSQMFCKYII